MLFRSRIALAPSAAFQLGAQNRTALPAYDVVWVARTDQERANDLAETAARLSSQAAEKYELPPFADGIEMHYAVKHRPPTVLLTDWSSLFCENVQNRNAVKTLAFDALSRVYLQRAIYMLSQGSVAVTDRLHAHILCVLMGVPHVFLNSQSGKNWNFYESWTRESPLCRLASSPAEGWTLARAAAARLKDMGDSAKDWSWTQLAAG